MNFTEKTREEEERDGGAEQQRFRSMDEFANNQSREGEEERDGGAEQQRFRSMEELANNQSREGEGEGERDIGAELQRFRLMEELTDDVQQLVINRLNLPDLYRFGLVCKSWKLVCDPMQFRNYLPWLIIPLQKSIPKIKNEEYSDFFGHKPTNTNMVFEDIENIGFFSLTDNKIYRAEIPELLYRRICGSCPGGWLITIHENAQIQLFNPFSSSSRGRVIHNLPPVTEFPRMLGTIEKKDDDNNDDDEDAPTYLYYTGIKWNSPENNFCVYSKFVRDSYLKKVAMSATTLTSGTIIMIIQGANKSLAYYRFGSGDSDKQLFTWTSVSLDPKYCWMHDLTFYRGKFYAVHSNGYVAVVHGLEVNDDGNMQVEKQPVLSVEVIIDEPSEDLAHEYYIVQSADDLLVVLRYLVLRDGSQNRQGYWHDPYKTDEFKVLKLDFGTLTNNWVEVKSLGDRSLFLGYNSSFSVSANNFSGCKPNCIYFTDNNWLCFFKRHFGGHDIGIFHLDDGSIEKFLYPTDTTFVMPPPVWFTPYPS